MKLGKTLSVEHIKRMTLRTVRESNEGQAEFLAFMSALERHDFDENLCKRESKQLEKVMTAKAQRRAAEHRSTLNFHVIRMLKGMNRATIQKLKLDSSKEAPATHATKMETLRGGLHAHKENVEASVEHNKLNYKDLSHGTRTPKNKFHPYSSPKSAKSSGKESSNKPRRALGDISNQQRNRQTDTGKSPFGKYGADGKLKSTTPSATPCSTKKAGLSVRGSVTPKPRPTRHDDVDEIEHAYGGLPSRSPDRDIIADIRREILAELMNDMTPSILDDFDPTRSIVDWEEERQVLESSSSLWASVSPIASPLVELEIPDVPALDDIPEPTFSSDDGLLDEVINTEIALLTDDNEEKKSPKSENN